MKKLLAILACSLALVAVTAPSSHALGVYGIWWLPSDIDTDAYGAGARLNKSFTPLIMYDIRASYVGFGDSDLYTIPLEATIMAKLGMLYGGVGYGYYFMSGENLKDASGWYILAGIQLGVSGTGLFGEVKWQSLESDVEDTNTSRSLDAIGIHVGVTLGM